MIPYGSIFRRVEDVTDTDEIVMVLGDYQAPRTWGGSVIAESEWRTIYVLRQQAGVTYEPHVLVSVRRIGNPDWWERIG